MNILIKNILTVEVNFSSTCKVVLRGCCFSVGDFVALNPRVGDGTNP